jgi:Domain of unknown function (DUF3472)/Domain of unknown function (DUF5077)
MGIREAAAAFGVLLAAVPLRAVPLPAQPTPTLRVPAFTAYVAPDPNAVRLSATRPVRPFVGRGTSLMWFGRLTQPGEITVAAAVHVPRGDSARLRLQIRGVLHERRVTGGDSVQHIVFGSAMMADTGYQRFTLDVADSATAPSVEIHALLLSGPASMGAHFNTDARRNAASVHLRYPTDTTTTITGFYTEVTAIDDPVTTYYMATGFARGYFGMQVNSPTERRIIFSVWDAASGSTAVDRSTVAAENYTQLVSKGDGVVAEVFGNEGTGGHSHLVYPWKTGSVQRFFVTAAIDGDATTYSGYWFHPERNAWQLIASFRAAKDGQGLRRLYSFSENFGGSTGHLRRKALFGAQSRRHGSRAAARSIHGP